jgi:hypothetical protein
MGNCDSVDSSFGCADCKEIKIGSVDPNWKGPQALYTTTITYDPPNTTGVEPYTDWTTTTVVYTSVSIAGDTPIVLTYFKATYPTYIDRTDNGMLTVVIQKGAPTVTQLYLLVKDAANLCSYTIPIPLRFCVKADSKVSLSDGNKKEAKDVRVGDKLLSVNGKSISVIGTTLQNKKLHQLVKIGDLGISHRHRVQYQEKWIAAEEFPGAETLFVETELYNFVTDERLPIIVDGIVITTIGMFCEGGTHDLDKYPTQRLWCTDKIIDLLKQQPTWPNVILDENLLANMKNDEWVIKYLESL